MIVQLHRSLLLSLADHSRPPNRILFRILCNKKKHKRLGYRFSFSKNVYAIKIEISESHLLSLLKVGVNQTDHSYKLQRSGTTFSSSHNFKNFDASLWIFLRMRNTESIVLIYRNACFAVWKIKSWVLTCFCQWATSKLLYTKFENKLESFNCSFCLQINTPSSSNVSRIAVIRNEISLKWWRDKEEKKNNH